MSEIKLGYQKVKKMGKRFHYLTVPSAVVKTGIVDSETDYLILLIPQSKSENKTEKQPAEVSAQ